MAVPFSNTKLRVPRGFQNALEGLAREVLRSQPNNIYQFAAVYFDSLIKIRDEEGFDPVETGARLEDRYYNNNTFRQNIGDVSDPQQQEAAVKIQSSFRGHEVRKDTSTKDEYSSDQASSKTEKPEGKPEENQEEVDIDLGDPDVEAAAVKIQAGFKGMKARKEVHEIKEEKSKSSEVSEKEEVPPAKEAVPLEAEKEEEKDVVDIDLTDPDVNKAAVQIQAGFRGYKAREEVKQKLSSQEPSSNANEELEKEKTAEEEIKDKEEEEEEEIDIDLKDPNVEAAAVMIQAGFKGMKTRQDIKSKKESAKSEGGEDVPAVEEEATPAPKKSDESGQYEEVDIDLNDPNVVEATIKIQAGFKGMKTRKDMKEKDGGEEEKSKKNEETVEEEKKSDNAEEIDINLEDPEVEKAAIKIQASFKGFKTRKEAKQTGASNETATAENEEVKGSEDQKEESKVEVNVSEAQDDGQQAPEGQESEGQGLVEVKVQANENDSAVVEEGAKKEESEDAGE